MIYVLITAPVINLCAESINIFNLVNCYRVYNVAFDKGVQAEVSFATIIAQSLETCIKLLHHQTHQHEIYSTTNKADIVAHNMRTS